MIFLMLVIFVVLFIFIAKFGVSYATKLTERLMTDRFLDANTIVNEKAVPKKWVEKIDKIVFQEKNVIRGYIRNWLKAEEEDKEQKAKAEVLIRLEKLAKYFEKCPFFEDPGSRKILLEELEVIRNDWASKLWSEIAASAAES